MDPRGGKLVTPVTVEAAADGVVIILGKKGEAIRFTSADTRFFSEKGEKAFIDATGVKGPLPLDGRAATAEALIQRFIAAKGKMP
jgi:hypothetical protein